MIGQTGAAGHVPAVRGMMFRPEMVRAILREVEAPGTGKTETRRKPGWKLAGGVEPARILMLGTLLGGGGHPVAQALGPHGFPYGAFSRGKFDTSDYRMPVGPGDLLWVRETFVEDARGFFVYLADDVGDVNLSHIGPWTPAIHMPRRASRITLTVTACRVERLQDITEEGAKAEGVRFAAHLGWWFIDRDGDNAAYDTAREAYRALINSIHGPGFWDANPWVVVTAFRPELINIDTKKGLTP